VCGMNVWTVVKVLKWATDDFASRDFEQPRLEAEVLLTHILKCKRLDLYTDFDRPLISEELSEYRDTITRRRNGEPAAYIIGKREFWSLQFNVDSRVLVPRPETEILVEAALARIPETGRVLDLCTGSGCAAIAIAHERPELLVDAVDISKGACEVAGANTAEHHFEDRLRVLEGDLYEPLERNSKYTAIVTNPPYVMNHEIARLSPEVRSEPSLALDGGDDGLDVIRRIVEGAPEFLAPEGWLLIEHDPRQTDTMVKEIGARYFSNSAQIIRDLAGRQRIVAWQK
jgi:release factor glutamine methyltransferase